MYLTIDVRDVLDELSDEDLVKEVVARKLQAQVQTETDAKSARIMRGGVQDYARDALEHVLGRRHQRALDAMRRAIEVFVPAELLAAYEHAQAQRWSAAVCELDRYVVPMPAKTTADLAKPFTRRSGAAA